MISFGDGLEDDVVLADHDPATLARLIEEAEAEVKRCEDAVLAARTEADAEDARRALTRAELVLETLLDQRPEGSSCEGWPRGK